jgi:hypothetical protein
MYKDLIIKVGKEQGLLRNQLAYVLATAEWETNKTFLPVKEAYYIKNAEAWRKKNLRYYPWYGRGFVQLTWKDNYIKAGEKLGIDLTTDPDKVMEPDISALILVRGMKEGWFTGKKLNEYITLSSSDFVNARRIVNGIDKAKEIAQIAKKYDNELLAAGYGVRSTEKPVQGDKDKPTYPTSPTKSKGLLELLIEFILRLFGKR